MKTFKQSVFVIGIYLFPHVIFAANLIIDNQTDSKLAFKVLHESGGEWCTGNTVILRLLVESHAKRAFDWDYIDQIFLFDKVNNIGFANIHLTNDCSDNPIASITLSFENGLVNVNQLKNKYLIRSESNALTVLLK